MQDHSANGLNSVSPINIKTNSLFLYPKKPDWSTEPTTLIKTLKTIELIGDEIPESEDSFFVGEQFLNYINFLGCAPNIEFNATDENPNFCSIRLIDNDEVIMIHTRSLVRAPHCPHCKKPVKQWQDFTADTPWVCPHCEQTAYDHDYDWRRTAGFARHFIIITDIYPKEALPQPSLLAKLSSLTQVEWDYSYYCA